MAHGSNPCIEFKASLDLERNPVSKTKTIQKLKQIRTLLKGLASQPGNLNVLFGTEDCVPCSLMWETVTRRVKERKHTLPARPRDRGQAYREPEDSATLGLTVLPPCDSTSQVGEDTNSSQSEVFWMEVVLRALWFFWAPADKLADFLPWCSTEILPPHSSLSCSLTRTQLSSTANQEQWLWSQTRRSHLSQSPKYSRVSPSMSK